MQLAVFGFVGLCGRGSNVDLEGVEADGYDLVRVRLGFGWGRKGERGFGHRGWGRTVPSGESEVLTLP